MIARFPLFVLGLVGSMTAVLSSMAMAQSAEFKCPKPGTVADASDGSSTTWNSQDRNFCKRQVRSAVGEERAEYWYAPTFEMPANRSQRCAEQLKPWALWPLTVGRKLTEQCDVLVARGDNSYVRFYTITIDAYEKLSTKAGTFDTFVVTRVTVPIHQYPVRATLRIWYAPDPGVVVKSTYIAASQGTNSTQEATAIRQ